MPVRVLRLSDEVESNKILRDEGKNHSMPVRVLRLATNAVYGYYPR